MPLRLTKRKGSNVWYLRGTVRGIPVYESTGTHNKEAAEALRIKLESELLDESIHGKKSTVIFAEAVDSYLKSGGSPKYLGAYTDGRWTGLLGHFFSTKLASIKQNELDAAARTLLPNVSPETLNRQIYTPFIAVWNHAVANDWAEVRKWRRPRKPKGGNVETLYKRAGTNPIPYVQAASFVAAMSPAPAMIMTALFYTGMRPSELLALTADDVYVADRWIVIRKSKTGEPRGVPMHEFLVPIFDALERRGGRLFRNHRGETYAVGTTSAVRSRARFGAPPGAPASEASPHTRLATRSRRNWW
jgi:integrase/recombinase XerD